MNRSTLTPSTVTPTIPTVYIEDLLLFQVAAVVLALACLLANGALGASALYSRRPRTGSRAKTILFLSQATAGLLSTFAVIYALKLAALHMPAQPHSTTLDFLTSFSSCFVTSSAPLIISTLTPVVHTLLLTIDLYLPLVSCQLAWQHWAMFAIISWFFILLFAGLPWMGWNAWNGLCYMPSAWTANFSGMISMLVILQAMACGYMLLGAFIRSRVGKEPLTEEEIPTTEVLPRVPPWEAKARFGSSLILLFCDMPLLLHIMVHSDILTTEETIVPPLLQLAWVARHDAFLPWAILLSLCASALLPPISIAADPTLSASLVTLVHRVQCWRGQYMRPGRHHHRRQRNNVVTPASVEWDRDIPH